MEKTGGYSIEDINKVKTGKVSPNGRKVKTSGTAFNDTETDDNYIEELDSADKIAKNTQLDEGYVEGKRKLRLRKKRVNLQSA